MYQVLGLPRANRHSFVVFTAIHVGCARIDSGEGREYVEHIGKGTRVSEMGTCRNEPSDWTGGTNWRNVGWDTIALKVETVLHKIQI